MTINNVRAVYFSPTGTTAKVIKTLGTAIADLLEVPCIVQDFTLPQSRQEAMCFQPEELIIFGVPVYAGRVPNVLLKYLAGINGNGAAAAAVVVYGNRNYDNALIELKDILTNHSLHVLGAGAFIGEHSFSKILAANRPDDEDIKVLRTFAKALAEKITSGDYSEPTAIPGEQENYGGYYQPRDQKGEAVDIRKVKPLTNEACTDCKICARVCPMGSISMEDVREYVGICIKCGACVKKCPTEAKYYDDAEYIYHKVELEEGYQRRAVPVYFC